MKLLPALLLLMAAAPAMGVTISQTFNPNQAVPDNNQVGVADFRNISTTIQSITSVTVNLTLTGGFNGDLYVYLEHGSGFSVLLNRAGVTASDDLGYSQSGFNVTFNDTAANGDIHKYEDVTGAIAGPLTGIWQPDGRTATLTPALDTDARPALLSSFNGLDANGSWTLFVADRSAGGTATLTSWGLTITGNVPEPSMASLGLLSLSGLLIRRRRS